MERGEQCYFIDQHAAHEKLLYDRLLRDYESKRMQTQPLMIPFVFDVSAADAELIMENLDLFEDCGLELRRSGNIRLRCLICHTSVLVSIAIICRGFVVAYQFARKKPHDA